MANLRNRKTPVSPARRFQVAAIRGEGESDEQSRFTAKLNQELAMISDEIAKLRNDIPDVSEFLREEDLPEAITTINETTVITSEGGGDGGSASGGGSGGAGGGGGIDMGAAWEVALSAITNAAATVAPPKVDDASALGTTIDPFLFSLEDHTHQGVNLDAAQAITGAKTFDLDPAAPFIVTASSAVVVNLDADLIDGFHASAFLLRTEWLQNGFPDRTEVTLAWVDGTRTLTVSPTAGSFTYHHDGVLYTESGNLTETITDTEGLWVIYIDGEGSMASINNPTDTQIINVIENETWVADLYWDATNSDGRLMPELHGSSMSPVTHHWLHHNNGTSFESGMQLSSFVIDDTGNVDTHAQFAVATGKLHDEDILHTLAAIGSTTGLEIWYLDGANWRWTTNAGFSVRTTGTGRLAWNDGGAQTEATNNRFILCHVLGSHVADDDGTGTRFIAIQGQAEYTTLGQARTGATTEMNSIVFGILPILEVVPVATVIFQTANAYANAIQARTRTTDSGDNYVDWRVGKLQVGAASVSDHGALSGREDDDHLLYLRRLGRTGQSNDVIISLDADGTLYGSAVSGSDLILKSTIDATRGIVDIEDMIEVVSVAPTITAQASAIEVIPNGISIGVNGTFQALTVDSTMTMTGNSNIFGTANLLNFAATMQNTNGVALNARPVITVSSNARMRADNAVITHLGVGVFPAWAGFYSNPRYSMINGGSGTAVDVTGFYSEGSIGTGWTVTNFMPIKIADPAATGTITNLIGIEIADMTAGGTLNLSIRSAGGEMRHAGAAIFGANAAAGAGQVEINQANAGGAIPCLLLDQDDIDDAFINFEGTSAADLSRSISTLTTPNVTEFVRVEVNGNVRWIALSTTPT